MDAYLVSVEAIRALAAVMPRVVKSDPELAKQMRRAAASVPLNLAEGRKRAGRDRMHLFRVAAGSNAEVRSCLDVAEAWGYVDTRDTAEAQELLDRVAAMLWRLTH